MRGLCARLAQVRRIQTSQSSCACGSKFGQLEWLVFSENTATHHSDNSTESFCCFTFLAQARQVFFLCAIWAFGMTSMNDAYWPLRLPAQGLEECPFHTGFPKCCGSLLDGGSQAAGRSLSTRWISEWGDNRKLTEGNPSMSLRGSWCAGAGCLSGTFQ